MKKIGFVDYYISEWHANNYPTWIKEAAEKLGFEYEVSYAWAEKDISPVDGLSTDQWCETMGVERCQNLAELCEKSDVIVILAPSNPEKHLEYAKAVLPYGKRTYIDKTFAPNFEIAKEIFDIGEKCGAPFFSSSALRYGDELAEFKDVKNIIVNGGGSNLDEYVIHLVEMAVSLLKNPARSVKVDCVGIQRICNIVTENGSKAAIIFSPALAYSVIAEKAEGEYIHKAVKSAFFMNLISDILKFFETGEVSFDTQETLEVMRLRDGILKAEKAEGEWIELN